MPKDKYKVKQNMTIQNGTYRNNENFSKVATVLWRKQKQRNRGERIIKGQREQNATVGDLDLRQSSDRGTDNAQGNSNEQSK